MPHPSRSFGEGGDVDSRKISVAILGGGLAGLAAGCALSRIGFRVTLFERRPYLGGRASSYEHPGTGEVVDNCQHVLFGVCTNLIAFYRELGIAEKIRWFDRMTFIEPGGRQSILESTSLPAPFHVSPSFLGLKFLSAKDKLALGRALAVLFTQNPKDDVISFHDWLIRHHQTPAAIERFWKPILISALSEDLDRISVPYAAQVVRETMKSRNARLMGVPMVPLTELYDAGRAYIESRGGSVRVRSGVQSVCPRDRGVHIKLQDKEEEFDYAVLAVPFDSLAKLLPQSPDSQPLRESILHFETSPITGVHLWFDRRITDLPHAVLLDRTIQWMFHKSMLLSSRAPVNRENSVRQGGMPEGNLSPLSSRAEQSRALQFDETPSYLELVISSSKSLIEKSRQEIIDLALNEVREFFPAARKANLVKATVIKEVNATFSPKPGIDQYRPSQSSPWPGIFLAGDWTDTGWPATMEGAVRSGYLAAEAITQAAGSPKTFLVPDLQATGFMRLV